MKARKTGRYSITYNQLINLEEELLYLKTGKRKQLSAEIRDIREHGNPSNNLHYSNLKAEERKTEARISEIDYILKHCMVVDEENVDLETIFLGSKVLLLDCEYDEEVLYSIVDTQDANSLENKISNQSPMGKALLGRKVGDSVTVQVGSSSSMFKVLKIEGIELGYAPEQKAAQKELKKVHEPVAKVEVKDIQAKDFLTRVHIFKCTSDNHKIRDIKCRVKVMSRNGKIDTYVIPGAYCETCDKYFMLDTDYKRLKQKGILICKVVEKDFWITTGKTKDNFKLNQESLLHMMGYNVNMQAGLSKEQRWGLLELIVDEGILTVVEIRSHLNWLIRRNQNNRNFEDARLKWQVDCEHLENYKTSTTNVIDVGGITSINYRK